MRKTFGTSLIETHSNNFFKSTVDGKTFAFAKTPDGSDKRRAHRELLAHIAKLESAEAARAASEPVQSVSQRIRDGEGTVKTTKRRDGFTPDTVRARIIELEKRQSYTFLSDGEKAADKKALERYREQLVKLETTHDEKTAHRELMQSDPVVTAIAYGEQLLQKMYESSTVSQVLIDGAVLAIGELKEHGNLNLWELKKASIEKYVSIEQQRQNNAVDRQIADETANLESNRPQPIV